MKSNYSQLGCILIGGLFLLWPAIFNGYPLLYSDSHVFISQPVAGFMNWDKPYIYGPLILLFHVWQTLWLVVLAQALLVSHLLWLVIVTLTPEPKLARATVTHSDTASPVWSVAKRHLLACGLLALASTAPWFVSFLMPDIFAAITVLCNLFVRFFEALEPC